MQKAPDEAALSESPPQTKPSREEYARQALEHTVVTSWTAWTLVALFLLTVAAVPLLQHFVEIRSNLAARREEKAATGNPPEGRLLPQSWDVLGLLPTPDEMAGVGSLHDAQRLLPSVGEIQAYETALEEQSVVSAWILPPAQSLLTGWLGAGNEQVYPGQNAWLHYRPDIDYLTRRGFLDPVLLAQRRRAGEEGTQRVQPDPIRAILHFQQQLARRGITLIILPIPVKPMIHPETLSSRYSDAETLPLQNPSWESFRQALEREGVLVFDAAPLLARAKRQTRAAQYLRTDTHWTPEAMERTAQAMAAFITLHVPSLPRRAPVSFVRETVAVENLGDIARMLKLPDSQRIFSPERVWLHPIRTAGGDRWRADRRADILLLGDSFSNIYSLSGMGWGEGAGFGEQLSAALKRPLDRIVTNAGGSYMTRLRLRQELLQGTDRLAGKRIVLYQFAMRDLASGDWKLLDLPLKKEKR